MHLSRFFFIFVKHQLQEYLNCQILTALVGSIAIHRQSKGGILFYLNKRKPEALGYEFQFF